MKKSRVLLFASVVAGAMVFGAVLGASAFSRTYTPAIAAPFAAASPSPGVHSNENASHEAGETASQEQAENNGTFRPGGFAGGHPCGGHSNEDATHEKSETAAQESGENAACPATATTPPTSG
ncbi:MAG TPA: hypothetical protein VNA65_04420 [Candidatus Dormibacteraeota bacterium]|nr:hypothetical protein [Candidatus Dormibacteraeota bacterium]